MCFRKSCCCCSFWKDLFRDSLVVLFNSLFFCVFLLLLLFLLYCSPFFSASQHIHWIYSSINPFFFLSTIVVVVVVFFEIVQLSSSIMCAWCEGSKKQAVVVGLIINYVTIWEKFTTMRDLMINGIVTCKQWTLFYSCISHHFLIIFLIHSYTYE